MHFLETLLLKHQCNNIKKYKKYVSELKTSLWLSMHSPAVLGFHKQICTEVSGVWHLILNHMLMYMDIASSCLVAIHPDT